ncbi:MAG: alginate export family protein [Shewanella sp.]|uniref:alginate export family protein n=1 Tax=Shewanella sp. TaxID=50422 RepID=UPI003F3855D9
MKRQHAVIYPTLLLLLSWLVPLNVNADSYGDLGGRRIVAVKVIFDGEQQDNETYRSAVLKAFGAYPGAIFEPTSSNIMLNKVKRLRFVNDAEYLPQLSRDGQVTLLLNVELTAKAKPLQQEAMGVLAGGGLNDFPTLFANDQQVLLAKLENKSLLYANDRAFFGRPEVLTAGNPLATAPSGRDAGPDPWFESSIETGVYGLSSFSKYINGFAGISAIGSGSWGPELFTDQTRAHLAVEDAYLGLMANNTTSNSGVRQMNLLVGRKAFQVDNGMILRLGSANGGERAALQANPRYAAEQLLLGQFVYDNHKLELFRFDPDELEELDSGTVIHGANYEGNFSGGWRLGAMYLAVPESRFSYYTNDSVFSREGLRVADLRLAYDGQLGQSNIYAQAEIAKQTHDDFDMDARAGYLEMGYRFMDWRFSPTLSYRYSQFSGDDPATATFERWDPLFAGGGGDEWVQGLNQYKVVQTSNVIAHRFMGRLFISPQLELTPQFWLFQADELNNLGGAQALSQFASKELGQELNVTARYVVSANLIFVFSAAYTIPGEAIREALNDDYHHWLSASTLMIARF